MAGVREHCEDPPVELWRNEKERLVIRAFSERGNNVTDVDLWDLLDWLSAGPGIGYCLLIMPSTGPLDTILDEIGRRWERSSTISRS